MYTEAHEKISEDPEYEPTEEKGITHTRDGEQITRSDGTEHARSKKIGLQARRAKAAEKIAAAQAKLMADDDDHLTASRGPTVDRGGPGIATQNVDGIFGIVHLTYGDDGIFGIDRGPTVDRSNAGIVSTIDRSNTGGDGIFGIDRGSIIDTGTVSIVGRSNIGIDLTGDDAGIIGIDCGSTADRSTTAVTRVLVVGAPGCQADPTGLAGWILLGIVQDAAAVPTCSRVGISHGPLRPRMAPRPALFGLPHRRGGFA